MRNASVPRLVGGEGGLSLHDCPHGVVGCQAIDTAILKTALHWLATAALKTRLDAVIVVPTIAAAEALDCALPEASLGPLIAGNLVRMSWGSLLLITPAEIIPSARRHVVVLGVWLNRRERELVSLMNPAASLVTVHAGGLA
jgi:hypothetical protein